MNINKLYWKALYYWIRYLNYNVIYRDKGTMKYGCLIRENNPLLFLEKMLHLPKRLGLINQNYGTT